MKKSPRDALLVLAGALVFFSVGAASRGLWEADEHRIAEIARVMTTPQGDLLLPHLDGAVYRDKPPLVAWIVALFHGPFGFDLATATKVPSIVGAALATLATFLIGRRLYGRAAGFAAAAALVTAAEFDWVCRRGQYDPLLTGFTTLGLWFFVRAVFPDPTAGGRTPMDRACAPLGFLCVGMAIFVKGPVALAFTLTTVVAFAAVAREWKLFAARRAWFAALALLPVTAWLVAAYAKGGWDYVGHIVLKEGVGHPAGDVDKVRPEPWYYLRDFPTSFLPWTLLLPAAVLLATRRREAKERRADLFVLAGLVGPFVVMSLFPAKRGIYLLPLFPAAALCVGKLAGVAEERLRDAATTIGLRAARVVTLLVGAALVLGAALAATDASLLVERVPSWPILREGFTPARLAAAALAGIVVAGLMIRSLRTASRRGALRDVLVAAVVASLVFAGVWLPAADPAASPRRFYEDAAQIVGDAPLARWGVDDFAPHWALRRDAVPFFKDADVGHAAQFLERPGAFLVVERPTVEKQGLPAGAKILLERRLPLEKDLLLLGR